MRLSRIWRILQIKEGVIHRGRRPRWITPFEICRILHILLSLEFNHCFIIHSKYFPVLKGVSPFRSLFFCLPKITQSRLQVFFGQRFNNLQQAALFTSLIQYDEDSFQQLVMVNYACGFNQSETGKYFELIMNQCHNMAPRLSGQLLYSVLFSLYSSLFYESRERKKLKIYNYDPKVSEPC